MAEQEPHGGPPKSGGKPDRRKRENPGGKGAAGTRGGKVTGRGGKKTKKK